MSNMQKLEIANQTVSTQFAQPTTEEFEQMLNEQSYHDTKKWTDLELNKIFIITDFRTVVTSNGESVILNILNEGEVWCPFHLADKIKNKPPPFYVRPLGLKPCKKNRKNKYHAYDLVIPEASDCMQGDYVSH